jgi:transcriptional regulator with XRE-family HTH domain
MDLLENRLAHIYSERPDLEGDRGQTGLVKASGASKSVVNQWLNGKIKSMDLRYALEIEKSLGYSHLWLMANIGEPKVKREPVKAPALSAFDVQAKTAQEQRLLTIYRLSGESGQAAFDDLIESLAGLLPESANDKTQAG